MPLRNWYLILTLAATAGVAFPAAAEEKWPVGQFRHADPTAETPQVSGPMPIKLLTDEDFPPFSFRREDGQMAGLAIDLTRAVCADLRLTCEITPKPWPELLPALAAGQGDAIISGVRIAPQMLETIEPTRPYYWALARLAVRAGETKRFEEAKDLDGLRVAVLAGSAHEAYLKRYFPKAQATPYPQPRDAEEALRTGQADAFFADAVRLIFWTRGKVSRSCCVLLPGAFFDPETFSNGLSFAVRRGRGDLRAAFDYALDRAQTRGIFADIMRRYMPASPW
jgi:polar amino acid transport system substrate-binding protein